MMDERGLTCPVGRKDGRLITKSGIEELGGALLSDRVGLVTTKIWTLASQTCFDLEKRTGQVPINVSLFSQDEFGRAMRAMKGSFLARLGIGELIAIAPEGEKLGDLIVPPGKVGLATVSHIVVCGALLRAGIPVDSRFGGIVQIRNHEAMRFVDLIEYASCSLDPAEVFIASRMTSVGEVAKGRNGKVLASFYEIPALARPKAEIIINELETADIKGLVMLGRIGEPVCQIPVSINKVGLVLADGLNPVAAARESGINVVNHAMSGVVDFGKLRCFRDC